MSNGASNLSVGGAGLVLGLQILLSRVTWQAGIVMGLVALPVKLNPGRLEIVMQGTLSHTS